MNNVKTGALYPSCWLTGGLHDPRVAFCKYSAEEPDFCCWGGGGGGGAARRAAEAGGGGGPLFLFFLWPPPPPPPQMLTCTYIYFHFQSKGNPASLLPHFDMNLAMVKIDQSVSKWI
jgi:hypothetical protein